MAAAEGWTPRRDNPYAGPGDEGLDDAAAWLQSLYDAL